MADLERMLKDKIDDLNGKRKSNADLKSAVKAKEKELRFQVSLAGSLVVMGGLLQKYRSHDHLSDGWRLKNG